MTQGGYQVIIILPIKSKMAATKCSAVLFAISVCTELSLHLRHSKSAVYR